MPALRWLLYAATVSASHLTIATLNANGVRSALRRGLAGWLDTTRPGVLLLQEVRADPMPEVFAALGYQSVWHPAQRPGYSGVAILSRYALSDVQIGFGDEAMDHEGRLISARVGELTVASLYLPSGARGERQAFKDRSLALLNAWVQARLPGPLVIGGDLNVAHQNIDIRNWKSNQKNSGFLPHEREWLGNLLSLGLDDSHRRELGEAAEYTWWSNRAGAYENDVGWRIDYLLAAGVQLRGVRAQRDARLSDHAPVIGTVEVQPGSPPHPKLTPP